MILFLKSEIRLIQWRLIHLEIGIAPELRESVVESG